MQTIILKS